MIHFYFIVHQYFRCIGGYNKKLHTSITWSFQLYSTILLWIYTDEILRSTSWSWWISIEIRCMKWIYGLSKNLNESFLFFIYYLFCFNSLMMNWERKKYRYLTLPYLVLIISFHFSIFHINKDVLRRCHPFFNSDNWRVPFPSVMQSEWYSIFKQRNNS